MNPLLAQALGAIFRLLLAGVAGFLVQHGIWTQADATQYVAAAALALVALAWSLWQKYKSRIHFLTALEMPAGTTETKVVERVKIGGGVLPIVLLALAIGASSCASLGGARHRAAVSVVSAKAVLGAIQDVEMTLVCGRSTAPPAPSCVPIEKHREISAHLVTAFDYNEKALTIARALPGGETSPDVFRLVGQIRALVDAVLALIPESPQRRTLVANIGGH